MTRPAPARGPAISRPAPARVVILGGGFGGLYAATYLAAADLPERAAKVTLVSDRNHFTFSPLLAEVVGGSLGREHVTFPYRVLAQRYGFRFLLARVEGFDPMAGVAHTTAGPVPFDHAIVALGAAPRYFGNQELRRTTMPFASVSDALAIRDRVLANAERAAQERSAEARRGLLGFTVAGAGPAGVEAASEIWHLLSDVLPRYYELGKEAKVTIVEGSDRILRGWDDELAAAGLEELRRRGIDVCLETRVGGYDGRVVQAEGPEGDASHEAGTLIWTAGTAPATGPLADSPLPRGRHGHLEVDECLRVSRATGPDAGGLPDAGRAEGGAQGPGAGGPQAGGGPQGPTSGKPPAAGVLENVFAVGDVASRVNPRTGRPYPPVAPIAISQGVRAAGNVENAIVGRPLEPYQAHHAGKIISLGNGVALVDLLGFRLRGPLAWAMYRATYLLKLVGTANKLRAGTTLLLNRLFERDLSWVG
ncbi:MAG: NAD(P)/FAD-dependent oxidoreductase [Gemmatimonadota bacterium]